MNQKLDIEGLAKKHLVSLGMWRLPVDPFAIAQQEGIELAPGRYGDGFDARIKYVRSEGTFILFYKDVPYGPTDGRVRFSISHELGHYYLPHHRAHLLRGESHDSQSDFRSRDPFEVEADEFASALLMPEDLFIAKLKDWNVTHCGLADFSRLADKAFRTSLTSTVRRYVTFDWEECSLIMSERGRVKWSIHSASMRDLHMGFVAHGSAIPAPTPAGRIWATMNSESVPDRQKGSVDADAWFENPWRRTLWEESMPLGHTGLVLTFLVSQDGR